MASSNKVYDLIADRIMDKLRGGTVPWRKGWNGGEAGMPRNLISGKRYRGINVLLLASQGYDSKYWLTYKQAQGHGGQVRKGQRATPIVFWKRYVKKADAVADGDASTGGRVIPVLRYYNVFNADQVDGLRDFPELIEEENAKGEPVDVDPIPACEGIVEGFENRPVIEHGGGRACYSPALDVVSMPERQRFESAEHYYSVLFHELTHSTGHQSRLGRLKDGGALAAFGSTDYSKEELCAEMGSAFLAGMTGIDSDGLIENSAAYIKGWLKALRDNPKWVVLAAAQAQKAVDHILNVKWDQG